MQLLRPLAVALLILLTAPLSVAAPPPLEAGPETTIITEPVRNDGTIDYHAALNARGRERVPAEDNAFIDIARLMPLDAWSSEAHRRRTFEALGVPVPPADTPYVSLEDFAEQHGEPSEAAQQADEQNEAGNKQLPDIGGVRPGIPQVPWFEEQLTEAMETPWTVEDCPLIAAWLDANAPMLNRLEAAARKSGYFMPYVGDGTLLEEPMHALAFICHKLPRMLTARIQHRIAAGDLDGAWRDVMTLKRLGRLIRQSKSLLAQGWGAVVESKAHFTIDDLLNSEAITRDQALRMMDDLPALPRQSITAQAIDRHERWLDLDWLVQNPPHADDNHRFKPESIEPILARQPQLDVNILLRDINNHYDDLVAILRSDVLMATKLRRLEAHATAMDERFNDRAAALKERLAADPDSIKSRLLIKRINRLFADMIVSLQAPGVTAAYRGEIRTRVMYRLERTAFALAAYRGEYDRYPDTLDALVPDYLPRVPRDVDGNPLRYRGDARGALLYSIGPDLVDHDGRLQPGSERDIGLRLGAAQKQADGMTVPGVTDTNATIIVLSESDDVIDFVHIEPDAHIDRIEFSPPDNGEDIRVAAVGPNVSPVIQRYDIVAKTDGIDGYRNTVEVAIDAGMVTSISAPGMQRANPIKRSHLEYVKRQLEAGATNHRDFTTVVMEIEHRGDVEKDADGNIVPANMRAAEREFITVVMPALRDGDVAILEQRVHQPPDLPNDINPVLGDLKWIAKGDIERYHFMRIDPDHPDHRDHLYDMDGDKIRYSLPAEWIFTVFFATPREPRIHLFADKSDLKFGSMTLPIGKDDGTLKFATQHVD